MITALAVAAVVTAPIREPVSVHAGGSGELQLAHAYPLGGLTYTTDPSDGRGLLTFEAGRGLVVLSGASADELGPSRYRLHLDTLQVRAMAHAIGFCDLTLSPDQRVYRTISCNGHIDTGESFKVFWRGVDEAAAPVR